MNNILELSEITKSFISPDKGKIHILQSLNLTILQEDSIAILGKSGSGKSTLLNIMAGLDRIDSGKVFFQNKN